MIRKNMGLLHGKHQCPCVLVAISMLGGCNASPQHSGITINVSNAISLKEGATYQIERSFIGSEDIVTNLARKKNMDLDEVFRGHAYSFAYVYTEESAYERVQSDAHPLSYLRCNMTAAQFDLFQETYHLIEDDVMYIPKEARVSIW